MLDILYQDQFYIAINKPHGLLVHKSSIANDASEFALQIVRDQIGQHVYPVHRIDRKTGGTLLFALDQETLKQTQQLFVNHRVNKTYRAIVRGFTPDHGTINYPLKKENGTIQEALTNFITIERTELPIEFGKHSTSRYSLIEARPVTGRMHQLRKHFAHINHPIIGDRPHGCNKQNKLFKENWGITTMLLHASHLEFEHVINKENICISAPLQSEFLRSIKLLNLNHFTE